MNNLKNTVKRVVFIGCIASSLLLMVRFLGVTSLLYAYCCVPLYFAILAMPGYGYLKIQGDYPKIDWLIFNIFMFCISNLSLFTSLFIIFTGLRLDSSISASWISIFISIYYSLFISFILLGCIYYITSYSIHETGFNMLLLWFFSILTSTILLSLYLDHQLYAEWAVLIPICIADLFSIAYYLYKGSWNNSSQYWQAVFYLFVVGELLLVGLEKWVLVYGGAAIFFSIEWGLSEFIIGNGYQQL